MKANIWLVVITFLAAVDGGLLHVGGPGWIRALVVSAGPFLAASGVATIVALWPREYNYPPEPRKVAERLEWIRRGGGAQPPWEAVRPDLLALGLARVESNRRLNRSKSAWLVCAYYLLLPALFLTLAALLVAGVRLMR